MGEKDHQIEATSEPYHDSELSQEITLFQLVMLGAGMMVGAGVFVATGIGIGIAGTGGILMAKAFNGVIAIFSALAMAELASAFPSAGGVYTYIREAFGGLIGYLSGWMNWFALAVAGSLYAATFGSYGLNLLRQLDIEALQFIEQNPGLYRNLLAVGVVVLFLFINYLGARQTGGSAGYIAAAQISCNATIGLIGVYVAITRPENLMNFEVFVPHGWGTMIAAMGFTYIGFEGYEVITHAGEEAVNPKEDIPKAIVYSIIIVCTNYLLMAFASIIGAPAMGVGVTEWFAQMGELGVAEAIGGLFPFGGFFISLAAIFASTSALNATTFSATRVAFALGRQNELPSVLSKISDTRRIPHIALGVTGLIIVPFALFLPIKDIAASADIMFILLFLMVNVAVIKIRQERGDELNYSFILPYFPYIPIIAIIAQAMLSYKLFFVSPIAWYTVLTWLGLGLVVYWGYSRHRIKERARKEIVSPIIAERKSVRIRDYKVMVPIANLQNASHLLRYAEELAYHKGAEMSLLNVIAVPEQTPLAEAEQFAADNQKVLEDAYGMVKKDLPVNTILRAGRNVARSISNSAREREADLLVLGWKGKIKKQYYEMGSNLDNIIERAPCDCIVIKPGDTEEASKDINNILLPTNGGFHSQLSAEVANLLAESFDANVTVLTIARGDATTEEIKKRLESVTARLDADRSRLKIMESDDVVGKILEEANRPASEKDGEEAYDLVIVGATEEGYFQQLLFGRISERVAAGCNRTLIMTKKNIGLKSISRRWLGRRDYLTKEGVKAEETDTNS